MGDLSYSTTGQQGAPNLVLVHGWGMNSAVWQPLLPLLEDYFNIYCVDLPGHGMSELVKNEHKGKELDSWANALSSILPDNYHYVGWSLGSLLGLVLAKKSANMLSFTMIASSPKFIESESWPAMPLSFLEEFARELKTDLSSTLKTFLALQFYNTQTPREDLRRLQRSVLSQGNASTKALKLGLAILRESDLREDFAQLSDVLVLLGERDRLVPVALKGNLQKLNPNADVRINVQAGHAPFVSHPEWVAAALLEKLS